MDPLQRREQILSCAMRLFSTKPYSEVMLRDIAAEAGVARPLIHHYFDTKRDLYLEALRRLAFIPLSALRDIPDGDLEHRIDASIARWMTMAERHRYVWLAVITIPTSSGDAEVDQILRQADHIAAERVIQAMRLDEADLEGARLKSLMTAFGGMARSACREWLIDSSLTRDEVQTLLSRTLLTVVRDIAPKLDERTKTASATAS